MPGYKTTRYIFPAPYVIYQRFSDCMIIACFNTGLYHRLSNEASELLEVFENYVVDNHTISSLKEMYPVTGSVIEKFINDFINLKLISPEKLTKTTDLPGAMPEQFAGLIDPKRLQLQTYTTMTHVLALKDIYNVDEKGWPVLNNG